MSLTKSGLIKAAGGVVVRSGDRGAVEVLLVHRPRHDDWTFPKGKTDPGERWRDTAIREVLEETGFSCRLDRRLRPIRYIDRKGRPKKVRYWLMSIEHGAFAPNDEVDEIRWCSPEVAAGLLTYERDLPLLDALPLPLAA
ncbi:MAG: NUDIX hydrolase [Acidimicrobiia bacterium]|nr:NUDIX hydrolase [Acidimicrobiia bacterium]